MDAASYKERNKTMSRWIDFSLEERKAMIQGVVEARQIDEAAAEKDWWVTAQVSCRNRRHKPSVSIFRLHRGFFVCFFAASSLAVFM